MTEKFNPIKYKAKCCNSNVWSTYEGQYVSCSCGAVAVDQTKHYQRIIGDRTQLEEIKDEEVADRR